MTTFRLSSGSLRLLFAALAASGVACKHDPNRTAAYIAAIDELQAALCECKSDTLECASERLASECSERIVHAHEDEIASWLACAIEETRARATCVREAACADDALETCGGLDIEDECGNLPRGPSMTIEREIAEQCDDEGSASSGSGQSAGSAAPSVSVSPPMATPTSPAPAPQPAACTTTPATLALVGSSCVSCACTAALFEATACDETCWRLLLCAAQHCARADGGADQTTCVVQNCSDSLAGAMAATKLGPILNASCADVCPAL